MSGASRAFVYSFAGALLCNFSLHLAESPRRARSISTPSTMLDVGLKTTREIDVTDAQSFFRAFPPTLPGVPPCAGSATGGAHGGT